MAVLINNVSDQRYVAITKIYLLQGACDSIGCEYQPINGTLGDVKIIVDSNKTSDRMNIFIICNFESFTSFISHWL